MLGSISSIKKRTIKTLEMKHPDKRGADQDSRGSVLTPFPKQDVLHCFSPASIVVLVYKT
jgi:hypothetical protein